MVIKRNAVSPMVVDLGRDIENNGNNGMKLQCLIIAEQLQVLLVIIAEPLQVLLVVQIPK